MKLYTIEDITLYDIADAIRAKNPNYKGLEIRAADMPAAINGIPSGGGGETDWSAIASGTAPESGAEINLDVSKYDSNHRRVRTCAFQGAELEKISGDDSLELIQSSAFEQCYYLTDAIFPGVTEVDSAGFSSCYSLTNVSIPNLTTCQSYAFMDVPFDGEVSFPLLSNVEDSDYDMFSFSADSENDRMTSFSAPELPLIAGNMFSGRSKLQTVNTPAATKVCDNAFSGCKSLQDFDFTKIESIGTNAFSNCYGLSGSFHFPALTHIDAYAFSECHGLSTLYFHQQWDEAPYDEIFANCGDELRDIYVPWSEGMIDGAPWGATFAAIHYDAQYDEDGNVIS